MNPNQYAKAIYSAIMAGLGTLGTAILDGHITPVEGIVIASAVLAAFWSAYSATNAPASPVAGETVAKPMHVEVQ